MSMELKAFVSALSQIAEEKGLPQEVVMEIVEGAIAAAYKKDYGSKEQEVRAKIDPKTGGVTVWKSYEVVADEEEVMDPYTQKALPEAKKIKKTAKVGDVVEVEDSPKDFGRIAAQTAKQVIIQRVREAERDVVFAEYKEKEDDLVTGIVQRIEGSNVFIDLGKATGVMFPSEQIPGERYYLGQRIKIYLVKVEQGIRGPQIVLSRSHPGMVRRLFEMEVPEIPSGTVELKAIAREAGARTKVAVRSLQEGVDPVGSCVGQRGTRIQAITAELGEEKVDVIPFDDDPKLFITNALSPAKVVSIDLKEADKKALVKVPEDQLSLAIGKQGQNVRLAAKLSGWNIDILSTDKSGVEAAATAATKGGGGGTRLPSQTQLEDEIIKAIEAQSGTEVHDTEHKEEVKKEVEGSEEGGADRDLKDAKTEDKIIEKAAKKVNKKAKTEPETNEEA